MFQPRVRIAGGFAAAATPTPTQHAVTLDVMLEALLGACAALAQQPGAGPLQHRVLMLPGAQFLVHPLPGPLLQCMHLQAPNQDSVHLFGSLSHSRVFPWPLDAGMWTCLLLCGCFWLGSRHIPCHLPTSSSHAPI